MNGKTGHLTKIVDNLNTNRNREYEFDAIGRLTKAKGGVNGALWSQNYSYDRFGNRTNVTASGVAADGSPIPRDGIPNLAYSNTSNRITTAGWEYDSAGNQTRSLAEDGVTWLKFEYDAANRIRVVKRDDAGQTMLQAFMYGSTNARLIDYDAVAGLNKLYASTAGTTLAEYTEFQHTVPTWTKSYTYLGDTQLATVTPNGAGGETTEFNHPDRLGTRVITNQQTGGNAEQAHLPFGMALNAESSVSSNNKRFTSYDHSPLSGLDYAVNRTYDSKQGRFTQVDPIGMQAASLVAPQTLNLYSYCANDPVNYTDPSGLFFGSLFKWIWKGIKIIAAVVFAVLAVLAFSIQQYWAGIALAMTSASIVADLFNLKTLQKLIAVASIAVSVVRLRMGASSTPPIFGIFGGGNGGIDIRVLSVFANVGAIANSLGTGLAFSPRGKRRNGKRSEVQRIADEALLGAINRLSGFCRTYILGPEDKYGNLEQLKKIVVQYDPTLLPMAQTVAGSGVKGVIKASGRFFRSGIRNQNGGWSYSVDDKFVREAFILHEIKHSLGGFTHPRDANGNEVQTGPDSNYGYMKAISQYCF